MALNSALSLQGLLLIFCKHFESYLKYQIIGLNVLNNFIKNIMFVIVLN